MTNPAPLPVVAIVGRPNVGKSSLVNRISGRKDAIVHGQRGVTRDRSYHEAEWNGRTFLLVDTGGIELARDDAFQSGIRAQAEIATNQADVIIFLVDGQTGLTTDDEELAKLLKRTKKPLFLAVNKVDNPGSEAETYDFWNLGVGTPHPISATHGNGTGDLLDEIIKALPTLPEDSGALTTSDDNPIKLALIGRPNAGKSSLTNQLARAERSIVSDIAGTTRDAVDTTITDPATGRTFTLIDTAGIRRKALIDTDVEYYGFVRAMRAIDRSDVTLLIIDAEIGLTDQDQRIASYAQERGSAIVVLLNKWDTMRQTSPDEADAAEYARETLLSRVEDRLNFISWAPIIRTSATTGRALDRVLPAAAAAFDNYAATFSTSALNRFLTELRQQGHTVSKGAQRLSIKYVAQTHYEPPGFTFFCNAPQLIDDSYARYLENRLRENFDLAGTPVILKFKRKT